MALDLLLIVVAVLVLTFMTLFAIIGISTIINMLGQILAVRKGCFRVIFRLPNHRIKVKYLKPEKESIRDGKDGKIYAFSNALGFVWYQGSTPIVEYDVNGSQLNFIDIAKSSKIDPSALDSLYMRAFNLGKKTGKAKENIAIMFTFIGIILNAAVLLLLIGLFDKVAAVV